MTTLIECQTRELAQDTPANLKKLWQTDLACETNKDNSVDQKIGKFWRTQDTNARRDER